MLQSLFGIGKPKFDPALGDPLGKTILDEAKRAKVDTLLREVDGLKVGQWDRRAFYVDLVGDHLSDHLVLDKLPDTPLVNTVRGSAGIRLAWRVRGGGKADTVSDGGWQLFFKHLDYAGKHLIRASEQAADDPTPLAFLQTVAMGMQLDRPIARGWFDEAVRRDPTNQQAHYRHLFLLLKKWGGSHEEMYDFARATMAKTPTSSTLHPSILYLAFQEHFLYLRAFDDDKEGARALLRDKNVREESLSVYNNSLKQRKRIESVADYWPHNVAAWWFMMLDMKDVVRQEIKKINWSFTEFPWSIFYNDPAAGYQRAVHM